MDKSEIRKSGISYRTALSRDDARSKSQLMSAQLKTLIKQLSGPYVCYTPNLPGELDPREAVTGTNVTFIEPHKDASMEQKDFTVVIVPMVAGDAYGNRVGMGGGWFDRFLAEHKESIVIGCCYDAMVLHRVPTEPHDIRVAYICTESKIIPSSVE